MAGAEAVGSIVGAGIGLAQGQMNNQANRKNQKQTYKYQRKLNEQGAELALQQWKDTNYSAQRRELEKAGLSTGLLYGQSGGGGVTANAGSGGSAPSIAPSNIDMGMGIQAMQAMASVKLMEAQTKKAEAEANKTAGVDTDNTTADTAVKNMQAKNQEIINNINTKTIEQQADEIRANADKAQSEARSAMVQANVDEKTQEDKERQIEQEALNSVLQGAAIKAGTKLTAEQTRKISVELAQGWEELYQKARANDNQKGMVNIAGFKAKLDEILGKANISIREKELMIRGAEAFVGGFGALKGKTTTTNSHTSSPTGETYHSSQSTTR